MPKTQAQRGQSMIEVIVASGIIMTAVSAALTLVSSSVNAEKNSAAQIAAGNLAREGVEAVRSIRDSNWLSGQAFDTGLVGTGRDYSGVPVFDPASGIWSFDFYPNNITNFMGRVYRYTTGTGNAVVGLMIQGEPRASGVTPTGVVPTGAVVSPYRRIVELDPMCDNGAGGYTIATQWVSDCGTNKKIGMRVISTVQWNVGGTTRNLSVEERLFDWR